MSFRFSLSVLLIGLFIGLSTAGCGSGASSAEDAAGDSSVAVAADSGIVLRLENGRQVILRDDTTAGDRFRTFEDRGFVEALQAHLIEVSFYEGGAYMLIHHRTGDTTRVAGPPVVSPSGDRFVVASVDLIAFYDATVLQVYRVREDRFVKEYQVEPETWGPSGLRWIAEDTLEFQQNVLTEEMEYEQHPARLVRSGTEWSLDLECDAMEPGGECGIVPATGETP